METNQNIMVLIGLTFIIPFVFPIKISAPGVDWSQYIYVPTSMHALQFA